VVLGYHATSTTYVSVTDGTKSVSDRSRMPFNDPMTISAELAPEFVLIAGGAVENGSLLAGIGKMWNEASSWFTDFPRRRGIRRQFSLRTVLLPGK
jgi:hypothetical protein